MKKILVLALSAFSLSVLANPYYQLCPTNIEFNPVGESLVYGWWSGLNKDGAEFESDHPNNPPQPGDVQGGTLIGLNNLLTDFVKVSNTMRCVYIVQNTHGYNVNVSLYNHNNYQQCTNGLVISATETCS